MFIRGIPLSHESSRSSSVRRLKKRQPPHFVTSPFYDNALMNISVDEITEMIQTSGLWQEVLKCQALRGSKRPQLSL